MTAEKVLVLRALGLGDTVAGIAALRGVRRAWPAGRIVLAAPSRYAGWLRGLGVVDEVLHTQGLARLDWPIGGHVAVNLHGCGPQSHRLLTATRPARLIAFRCGAAGHDEGPDWSWDEHEVVRWCRLVSYAGGPCGPEDLRLPPAAVNGNVVVHPGAASAARRWPEQRWREVVRSLVDRGHDVAVTGDRTERSLCAGIVSGMPQARSLAGRLSVSALAELIAGAALLLASDTGPAHLATAYGTPSVLLFGPTSPARWGPVIDVDRHVVLWHGGSGHGDPHAAEVDPALARIEVDEVLSVAFELLARIPQQAAG
ncbi:MAG TPA: glycosyltransferase family 9 protein [Jiangellaceae bacterium]